MKAERHHPKDEAAPAGGAGGTLMRTGSLQRAKGMELKQEKTLTREEAKKIVDEMADLMGDRLKNHKDGDAERFLFNELLRKRGRKSSHADR